MLEYDDEAWIDSRSGRNASQITPQLYLSDYWIARNPNKLRELGITHVVSLLDFNPGIPDCISSEKTLHVDIADLCEADILEHLPITTAFIIAAIQEHKTNKVLVHCMMGISRSPTVVCAYLVATSNMTASESITHVQNLRPVVYPNHGFRQQLERYSRQGSKQGAKTKSYSLWTDIFRLSSIASWIRQRGKPQPQYR